MTASRVNAFASDLERLIDNRVPPPVVNSWNGLTGDVKGTLAEIFAFGESDDPVADNFFAMPNGNMRFRSTPAGGGFTLAAYGFFEQTAAVSADGRVATFVNRRTQRPGEQGTNFGPADVVYNAGYVGNLIDGTSWGTDVGYMTASTDETHLTGDNFWSSTYLGASFFFNQPLSLPDHGGSKSAAVVYLNDALYAGFNSGNAVRQARQLSGFGQEFVFPRGQVNGVTPGFLSVWTGADIGGSYQAGDGTGLWLAFGDPSHINDQSARGIFEAHMLTGDPSGNWGTGIWSWDPAIGGGSPYQIAEFDKFVGLQLLLGGVVFPGRDSTAEPLSPGLSAKVIWDDTLQKMMISVDGAAFVPLSTFS